ncbi:MAG: hypothetical protein HOB22_09775 [Candidatus Marinimicrobia bacterium]|nr:hypothetical protein [Candidatus Neomarinimicrobiota bacterium]
MTNITIGLIIILLFSALMMMISGMILGGIVSGVIGFSLVGVMAYLEKKDIKEQKKQIDKTLEKF